MILRPTKNGLYNCMVFIRQRHRYQHRFSLDVSLFLGGLYLVVECFADFDSDATNIVLENWCVVKRFIGDDRIRSPCGCCWFGGSRSALWSAGGSLGGFSGRRLLKFETKKNSVITACQRSCGKVMFSYVSVCPQGGEIPHVTFTHDVMTSLCRLPRLQPRVPLAYVVCWKACHTPERATSSYHIIS